MEDDLFVRLPAHRQDQGGSKKSRQEGAALPAALHHAPGAGQLVPLGHSVDGRPPGALHRDAPGDPEGQKQGAPQVPQGQAQRPGQIEEEQPVGEGPGGLRREKGDGAPGEGEGPGGAVCRVQRQLSPRPGRLQPGPHIQNGGPAPHPRGDEIGRAHV